MNAQDNVIRVRRSGRTPKPKRSYVVGLEKKRKIVPKEKNKVKSSATDKIPLPAEPELSQEELVTESIHNELPETRVVMEQKAKNKKPKKKARRGFRGRFWIECREVMERSSINVDDFKIFLQERMKVNGILNDGRNITIEHKDTKVLVNSVAFMNKPYLKFMIKKYLKNAKVHNFIHVVANGSNSFELGFR